MESKEYEWAKALCYYAGKDEQFLQQFYDKLTGSTAVMGEFRYYLEHQNFLNDYKVKGYGVVDIMVWQMDHFKANLDRGQSEMKNNGDLMLLMAFDTLLNMEKDPERYVQMIQTETGTDYPDKYK